mgnify:CR=1 FL=1
MRSEHFADLYKFEWDQRTHLTSLINIPIVGLTALATVTATIAMGFPYSDGSRFAIFQILIVAAATALAASLIMVLLSLLWVDYKKMPSPVALRYHYKALLEWHRQAGRTEIDAARDFQDSFDEHLATAAEANGRRNKFRGNCVFFASAVLALSLIPLGGAAVVYVMASVSQPEKVYTVRVLPSPIKEQQK